MKRWRGAFLALVLLGGLAGARPASAGYLEDAGWGSLTMLTNVIYMPAKLCYAALGGVTGGLALALTAGDMETAETVWVTTMGGTYVVTPGMLRGEESIAFSGTPSKSTEQTNDSPGLEERPLEHQLSDR
jgi:hypothetical protein